MLGEVTMPPPSPASSRGPMLAHCAVFPVVCRSPSAVAISPITMVVRPHTVSQRPTRDTSRPATIAEAATPRAKGVTVRPERSGE